MNLLTFTTLYPNAVQPRHGIFVEQRLRHLLELEGVTSRVVAPVPWFPFSHPRFGRYADYARVPAGERRHGIEVRHPRYPVIPRIGSSATPFLLDRAMRPVLRGMLREGVGIDLIDAHYFYPDGVAAVRLGARLDRPVVITARGSDLNLISRFPIPRRQIVAAARRAAGLITVSRSLKDRLVELGTEPARVTVLRNGVDLELFRPVDRPSARTALDVTGRVLLSVGNLIELKGHHLIIRALTQLPDTTLVIAGEGPERGQLEQLAESLGLGGRVRFAGLVAQPELRTYYSASDALVLASSREGWANVLLESMACGTPVVATAVGGTPEVVTAPEAGLLVQQRTPEAIAAGIERLFEGGPDRSATRRFAEDFDWAETSRGQLELFERVVSQRHRT